MRYGIISDIHGNLEALEAAIEALTHEKIDELFCVGDIVGYGADPAECIKRIKKLHSVTVCGNHDAASSGVIGTDNFSDAAREAVLWTGRNIGADDMAFLQELPITFKNRHFTLVHGTLEAPEKFHYMLDKSSAEDTFRLMENRACFVGHSHIPGVFTLKNGGIEYAYKEKTVFANGEKVIVNAGSVGQPRDGDSRLCYAVYDVGENSVELKRAPYDIAKAQNKILDAGLPFILAYRLSQGA